MGLFNLGDSINKGIDIIDQAVLDKDKANELKFQLMQNMITSMYTGPGSKITKWTLCFLVTSVVWVILYTFLTGGNMDGVLAATGACGGVIGLMTGGWVYGSREKRKFEAIAKNGVTKDDGHREPYNPRPKVHKGPRVQSYPARGK